MMNVMLIDPDPAILATLNRILCSDSRFQMVSCCPGRDAAWRQFQKQHPDAVFISLDKTQAGKIDGLVLAERIRRKSHQAAIIFLSDNPDQAMAAFRFYPLDYLVKPINQSRLRQTLDRLFFTAREDTFRDCEPKQSKLQIRCFGQFDVLDGSSRGGLIRFPTKKCRELLAYLLCHHDRPVTRGMILDHLFDGLQDARTINQLHVTVYQLRKAIGQDRPSEPSFNQVANGIQKGRYRNTHSGHGLMISGQYQLCVEEGVCDLVDFTRMTQMQAPLDDVTVLEAERVAGSYRGMCFEHEEYPWVDDLRNELDYSYEQLLLKIADYHRLHQNPARSERSLKTLVQMNPFSEDGNYALMDLYLERKDRRKFFRQYEAYQRILADELGAPMDQQYQAAYRAWGPS